MHYSPLYLLVSGPTVAVASSIKLVTSLGFLCGRHRHRPSTIIRRHVHVPPPTSYFVDCAANFSSLGSRTRKGTVMSAKTSGFDDCHDADELGDDGGGGDELVFHHQGIPKEYSIIQHRTMPETGFADRELNAAFKASDIDRLKLTPDDVTTTAALLLLYPEQYQSHTRARKDCRKKKVLIHRGSLGSGDSTFARDRLVVGRVIDRVKSGDTVCIQQRMQPNYDECKLHDKEPPFNLPVVFEDDHFAVGT